MLGRHDAGCGYFIWFDKEEVHDKDEKVEKLEDFYLMIEEIKLLLDERNFKIKGDFFYLPRR